MGRALPTYEEVGDIRPGDGQRLFPSELGSYIDGNAFHWGESVFNHYDGKDKWVIRKQLELLGEAGVDVLF